MRYQMIGTEKSKSLKVDAFRLEDRHEYPRWFNAGVLYGYVSVRCDCDGFHALVSSPDGEKHIADEGDYIVRTDYEEIIVLKPDVFNRFYRKVGGKK